MKYVYQIKWEGVSCDMRFDGRSSTVFSSRELAEKRFTKCREILCESSRPFPLDPNSVRLEVAELELVE